MYSISPKAELETGYSVGQTGTGTTVLKIHTETGVTSLALNSTATLQLIRLLQATLPEEDADA